MGTRADFYIGRGVKAEWLGSIAWDGYPIGLDKTLLASKTEASFRRHLRGLTEREDWTAPKDGWPWPWDNSQTTDYAYAFDVDQVWASCFGSEWFEADGEEPEYDDRKSDKVPFPDMARRKKVTLGKRSGVIVIGGRT